MSNPSEILDAQINAGWKHADAYDGDDRQDIKSDVFNAFQAGVVWERRRALEGRPSLEMAPTDLDHQGGAQAGAVQRPADLGRTQRAFRIRQSLDRIVNAPSYWAPDDFRMEARLIAEMLESSLAASGNDATARSDETSKPEGS